MTAASWPRSAPLRRSSGSCPARRVMTTPSSSCKTRWASQRSTFSGGCSAARTAHSEANRIFEESYAESVRDGPGLAAARRGGDHYGPARGWDQGMPVDRVRAGDQGRAPRCPRLAAADRPRVVTGRRGPGRPWPDMPLTALMRLGGGAVARARCGRRHGERRRVGPAGRRWPGGGRDHRSRQPRGRSRQPGPRTSWTPSVVLSSSSAWAQSPPATTRRLALQPPYEPWPSRSAASD